jgi:hypothetical protein
MVGCCLYAPVTAHFTVFVIVSTIRDRLCGLVVRVAGYTTEMYCDSCEVQTEFIYVI